MEVSIAIVRLDVSPKPTARGSAYPTSPPSKCNIKQGICKFQPAARIGSLTWATADATNKHVLTTPTTGAKGRIFFTKSGKNRFRLIPKTIGASTTCTSFRTVQSKKELRTSTVDLAIPMASTGTTAPKMDLQSKGVMKIAPSVVAVVMRTERATLPLAM